MLETSKLAFVFLSVLAFYGCGVSPEAGEKPQKPEGSQPVVSPERGLLSAERPENLASPATQEWARS
jgi:hypothetical protein